MIGPGSGATSWPPGFRCKGSCGTGLPLVLSAHAARRRLMVDRANVLTVLGRLIRVLLIVIKGSVYPFSAAVAF